jgi:hypothetical protein
MRDDPRASPPSSPADRSSPDRLYPRLLGAAWDDLDPAVRRVHRAGRLLHAEGIFQVSRAPGRLMGLLLTAARVPRASEAAEVRVTVDARGPVEHWRRAFDGRPLVTLQSEAPGGLLAERIGPLEFRFRLLVRHGELVFRQDDLGVRLGSLRLPVPHRLAPQIAGREGPVRSDPADTGDRTRVDVRVMAPGGSLLFAYRGTVRWTP